MLSQLGGINLRQDDANGLGLSISMLVGVTAGSQVENVEGPLQVAKPGHKEKRSGSGRVSH